MTPNEHHRPASTTRLCIDDDPAITTAIRLRLSHYDVNVRTASDGHEGMWAAVNECLDVIVTDIRMPNGDGDYVIECLKGRADTSNIPVIVLTGRRDQELERWMLALGVEHYLHKPVSFDRLTDELRRNIDLRSR